MAGCIPLDLTKIKGHRTRKLTQAREAWPGRENRHAENQRQSPGLRRAGAETALVPRDLSCNAARLPESGKIEERVPL